MRGQPFLWSSIGFLALVVVIGPAFWGTVQENHQLAFTVKQQAGEIANLTAALKDAEDHFSARVRDQVDSVRAPLAEQLADARGQLREKEAEIARLAQRHSFQRAMQAKLEKVQGRIAALAREAGMATGDEEVELRKQLVVLQTRHEQAEHKLDTLNASADEEWDACKQEVTDAWSLLTALLGNENYRSVVRVATVPD